MYSLHIIYLVFISAALSYGEPNNTFRDYFYMERTHSFYKFHHYRHRTWQDAVDVCLSEGATLYVPQDETEASDILNKVKKEVQLPRLPNVWIGVTNLRSNEVFETVDGRPINEIYNKWASGYPNKIQENHCVHIDKNLMLKNYQCDYTWKFFCKYTPKNTTNN